MTPLQYVLFKYFLLFPLCSDWVEQVLFCVICVVGQVVRTATAGLTVTAHSSKQNTQNSTLLIVWKLAVTGPSLITMVDAKKPKPQYHSVFANCSATMLLSQSTHKQTPTDQTVAGSMSCRCALCASCQGRL